MIGADGLMAGKTMKPDTLDGAAAQDIVRFAEQEPDELWYCTGCLSFCSDHDVVVCAPLGRTYVLDGIPEDGYEPKKTAALVSDRLCRECGR